MFQEMRLVKSDDISVQDFWLLSQLPAMGSTVASRVMGGPNRDAQLLAAWSLRKQYMLTAHTIRRMQPESRTLALLIDAENIELPLIERVLAEANRHGNVKVRRAYGDWDSPRMSVWKRCLTSHGVDLVRQREPVRSKNSADLALREDAWKMLRSEVGGFCIVASDNGYAGLVAEMHRQGVFVMGIGAMDKPPSYREMCNVFRYAECLPPIIKTDDTAYGEADIDLIDRINEAIDSSPEMDGGWVRLADVKNRLQYLDIRAYCHKKMLSLVRTYPKEFETREGETDRNSAAYYVRSKRTL